MTCFLQLNHFFDIFVSRFTGKMATQIDIKDPSILTAYPIFALQASATRLKNRLPFFREESVKYGGVQKRARPTFDVEALERTVLSDNPAPHLLNETIQIGRRDVWLREAHATCPIQ